MKQITTIERLKKLLPYIKGIDAAILYGSFGRNEANPNSDVDIQLLVDKDYSSVEMVEILRKEFPGDVKNILEVKARNKVVMYFTAQPKVEFAICTELHEIDRNYLGSEISDVRHTILYEKQPAKYNILAYLERLITARADNNFTAEREKAVADLIARFIYEFESCSVMHRRSDGYQFYFFYNIALQLAIQLHHILKGQRKFNFLPKYFIANVLSKEEQEPFYQLKGTLFLPEANKQKRKLLDFFYTSIQTLVTPEKQDEVREFCEWIYNRDYLWNFRDINTHNSKVKGGRIFRTATMSLFQDQEHFEKLLDEKQIRTVIDLRADREIDELPYSEATLKKFKYVRTPLDPWNQPEWFVQNHHQGTNEEIAYRFFGIGCREMIKGAMEAIIEEESGSVAIHCFAGKDRTGIFVALLHLLVDTPIETIHADYLASEVDVKLHRLHIVLDIVAEKGGVEPYLLWCGLSEDQIVKLKLKLLE